MAGYSNRNFNNYKNGTLVNSQANRQRAKFLEENPKGLGVANPSLLALQFPRFIKEFPDTDFMRQSLNTFYSLSDTAQEEIGENPDFSKDKVPMNYSLEERPEKGDYGVLKQASEDDKTLEFHPNLKVEKNNINGNITAREEIAKPFIGPTQFDFEKSGGFGSKVKTNARKDKIEANRTLGSYFKRHYSNGIEGDNSSPILGEFIDLENISYKS